MGEADGSTRRLVRNVGMGKTVADRDWNFFELETLGFRKLSLNFTDSSHSKLRKSLRIPYLGVEAGVGIARFSPCGLIVPTQELSCTPAVQHKSRRRQVAV